jgi:hypothetical protein
MDYFEKMYVARFSISFDLEVIAIQDLIAIICGTQPQEGSSYGAQALRVRTEGPWFEGQALRQEASCREGRNEEEVRACSRLRRSHHLSTAGKNSRFINLGQQLTNFSHLLPFRIAMHQQKTNKHVEEKMEKGAVPAYLLDREQTRRYDNKPTSTHLPSLSLSLALLHKFVHTCLWVACWVGY